MSKICNEDCFNCPYSDCINDDYIVGEYAESVRIDTEIRLDYDTEYRKRKLKMSNYDNTEKGKARMIKYRHSEKGKAVQFKANHSQRGIERRKRYENSEKGKETRRKYQNSEAGKAARRRYEQSEHRKKYHHERYLRKKMEKEAQKCLTKTV